MVITHSAPRDEMRGALLKASSGSLLSLWLSMRLLKHMGTSLTRRRTPLQPYRRPKDRVLGGS